MREKWPATQSRLSAAIKALLSLNLNLKKLVAGHLIRCWIDKRKMNSENTNCCFSSSNKKNRRRNVLPRLRSNLVLSCSNSNWNMMMNLKTRRLIVTKSARSKWRSHRPDMALKWVTIIIIYLTQLTIIIHLLKWRIKIIKSTSRTTDNHKSLKYHQSNVMVKLQWLMAYAPEWEQDLQMVVGKALKKPMQKKSLSPQKITKPSRMPHTNTWT